MMDFSRLDEWIRYGSFVLVVLCFVLIFLKILYEMEIIKNGSWILRLKNTVLKCFGKLSLRPSRLIKHDKKELKLFLGFMLMAVGSRIMIYIVGYLFDYYNKKGNLNFIFDFEELWKRWDSVNYVYLAKNGYTTIGEQKFYIAFYPLYPSLIKLVAIFVRDYFVAALIVSNTALTIASYFLYKLCRIDYDDKVAFGAVKYMLIFPFTVFFGIAFTESLFVALTIVFFYQLRKQNWHWAAFIGMLSALCKNQGVILVIPYMIEVLISLEMMDRFHLQTKWLLFCELVKKSIPVILIPFGLGLYLLTNKIVTGDWFKFLEYQNDHWNQRLGFLGDVILQNFEETGKWGDMMQRITIFIPQIILFFIAIILVLYGIKRMRGSYLTYIMIYLSITYSATWLLSGARYSICMFPLFILISLIARKNRYLDFALTFTSLIFLGYYTINYIEYALI